MACPDCLLAASETNTLYTLFVIESDALWYNISLYG